VLKGTLHLLDGLTWDISFVDTENKASQKFIAAYNVAKIGIALGDPAVCAAVPGCTPLDLFGVSGTATDPGDAELQFWRRKLDSSDQKLKLVSANITGTIFHIQDRAAGLALGAEHRLYDGVVQTPILCARSASFPRTHWRFPSSASYHVNEVYTELSLPLLKSLGASAAVALFGLFDLRQHDHLQGRVAVAAARRPCRARHLFDRLPGPESGRAVSDSRNSGATLVDPCGPTGGVEPTYRRAVWAQGCQARVPAGQHPDPPPLRAVNPNLQPEKIRQLHGWHRVPRGLDGGSGRRPIT